MAKTSDRPSYSELTERVVRESAEPIPFDEIMRRVNAIRRIDTRVPKQTIRSAISQCRMIVSTGDGRYGWYPRLMRGSFIRAVLVEADLKHTPLRVIFDDEVREMLWPSFFSHSARYDDRNPIQVEFASGDQTTLPLDFFGEGQWEQPARRRSGNG